MEVIVDLYSENKEEIKKFLDLYSGHNNNLSNNLKWRRVYKNPIQAVDIIGIYIENNDKFRINMWVSIDKDFFINITDYNADKIIRYLYERYPY